MKIPQAYKYVKSLKEKRKCYNEIMDYTLDNATQSLFRFEGLQDYTAMDGEGEINHFIQTGKLLTTPETVEWCQKMKAMNERGIITTRVRMIVVPLNNYTKWELAWHKAAAEFSGDDIRVIEEDKFKVLFPKGLPDFWMIDHKEVVTLAYGPQGKFLKSEQVSLSQVGEYVNYRDLLLQNSIQIAKYL